MVCLTTDTSEWNSGVWHALLVCLAFSHEKWKPVQNPGLLRIRFVLLVCLLHHLLADEEKKNAVINTAKDIFTTTAILLHFWFCSVDWIILVQYFYVTARGMYETLLDGLER